MGTSGVGRCQSRWVILLERINSYFSGEFSFNIGPHLVGSMWILKWTYGNFKRFILLNAIVDVIFTFPLISLLKKLKVVTLVRLNNWQFFVYIFYKAFLLYGLQYLIGNKRD